MTFDNLVEMADRLRTTDADKFMKRSDVDMSVPFEYEVNDEVYTKDITIYGKYRAAWNGRGREPSEPEDVEIIGIVDNDSGMESAIPFTSDNFDEFKQQLLELVADERNHYEERDRDEDR